MEHQQAKTRFYESVWPQMPVVLRTAQILCGGDVMEAEDLTQETMLKAFRALDRFQPGTDLKAWLLAILRNVRIDRLRSVANAPALSLESLGADPIGRAESNELDRRAVEQNPELVLARFSDRQMIEALGRLPEEIRWTLLLVDIEGMGQREAAELLEVPVGTIKSRAHRGRMMLRDSLVPIARRARIPVDHTGKRPEVEREMSPDSKIGHVGDSDGNA